MSETTEDYNARMYETFQMLGTTPQEWKWDGQDPEEARGFGGTPAGTCGLCGKHPIAYIYTIVHVSGRRLKVGSECVSNFVEAAPYSKRRKAKDAMKRLTLLNKMTNYIVEQKSISYEEARKEADKMTQRQIEGFFADITRERNTKKLKIRAEALGKLILENQDRLWNQNWQYFGSKTVLSSLHYMKRQWETGRETPYMEGPMNAVLSKFGLSLPAKPKLKDLEEQ